MSEPIARRDQILTAALDVFGRYGYRRSSMDLIAQAARISRPAVYQYFGGKEAVFRAVGQKIVDEVVTAAAAARRPGRPVADQLVEALSVKLDLVTGTVEAHVRSEIFAEAGEVVGDVTAEFHDRYVAVIEGILEASASGLDRLGAGISAHDAALVLVDALPGIAQEPSPGAEARTRLRQLVDLVVRGLGG
jgi:AcrR family transcriptional regulator